MNRSRVEDLVQQARCELGSGNRTNALGLLKRALSIDPDGDAITQTILAIEKDLVGRSKSAAEAAPAAPVAKSSPASAATDAKSGATPPGPSADEAKQTVRPVPKPAPEVERQALKPDRTSTAGAVRPVTRPAPEPAATPPEKPAAAAEERAAKPSPAQSTAPQRQAVSFPQKAAAAAERPAARPAPRPSAEAERPAVRPVAKPSAEAERPAVRPAATPSAVVERPAARPVPKPSAEPETKAVGPPQKAAAAAERPTARPPQTPAAKTMAERQPAAREPVPKRNVPDGSPPGQRQAPAAAKESTGEPGPPKRREAVSKGGDDGAKKRLIEEIFALSESALKTGDDTGALECLKRAEVLSPENPEVQERMAYLRKSLKAKIMIKTGYSRLAEENFIEAVSSARKAFDLSPDVDGLEAFISEIENCSRDSEEEVNPSSAEYDDAEVWVSRIRSRIQEGAFPLAAELAARASAIYPDHELIRTFVERFTKMKLLQG